MDLKKIFIRDAKPTKIGGQAVLDGIMMKGPERQSIAIRLPNDQIHIKVEEIKKPSKWAKYPLIRGVLVFLAALVEGTKTLMYSADVLEANGGLEEEEPDKFSQWMERKFGAKKSWNIMIYLSVIMALFFTVLVFIIAPTAIVNLLKHVTHNGIVLNLVEGLFRIALFVIYVVVISRMEDIKKVFQFHGAEHKCIHCYENGLPLTPANCQGFLTLHPRCGTSFLMFVMVISLVLFSLLGWPNLILRISSRILLLPVIAGLSYELLRWAGRSDSGVVKALSVPGLLLQKLTTKEPNDSQLEVAIAAMEAVLRPETPIGEGICNSTGQIIDKDQLDSEDIVVLAEEEREE